MPPEWKCLRAALPRLVLLYDLSLLLLSAAALPVSEKCSLISVYRQSHQCGERSKAAFRRQSAARQTSLAPHDSKARLQSVTTRRKFMAKPCTPHLHCAARAALRALNCQCAGSRGKAPRPFSWGCKGDILFREREYPPLSRPHTVWGTTMQRCRAAIKTPLRGEGAKKGSLSAADFFSPPCA